MTNPRRVCIINCVVDAALAHLVERHLAKVEVASSSLVGRSIIWVGACRKSSHLFLLPPALAGRGTPSFLWKQKLRIWKRKSRSLICRDGVAHCAFGKRRSYRRARVFIYKAVPHKSAGATCFHGAGNPHRLPIPAGYSAGKGTGGFAPAGAGWVSSLRRRLTFATRRIPTGHLGSKGAPKGKPLRRCKERTARTRRGSMRPV